MGQPLLFWAVLIVGIVVGLRVRGGLTTNNERNWYDRAMTEEMETKWKFGWNRWIGIMYGPIPVGLILVVGAYGAYAVMG